MYQKQQKSMKNNKNQRQKSIKIIKQQNPTRNKSYYHIVQKL